MDSSRRPRRCRGPPQTKGRASCRPPVRGKVRIVVEHSIPMSSRSVESEDSRFSNLAISCFRLLLREPSPRYHCFKVSTSAPRRAHRCPSVPSLSGSFLLHPRGIDDGRALAPWHRFARSCICAPRARRTQRPRLCSHPCHGEGVLRRREA